MPSLFSFDKKKASTAATFGIDTDLVDSSSTSSKSSKKKGKKSFDFASALYSPKSSSSDSLSKSSTQRLKDSKRNGSSGNGSSDDGSSVASSGRQRRKRARPVLDALTLAATSIQKLESERLHASCELRRLVLIQNLLNAIYENWNTLMEKTPHHQHPDQPASVVAATDLIDPQTVDEAPAEAVVNDVRERRKSAQLKKRGALTWRRKAADSAVDLSNMELAEDAARKGDGEDSASGSSEDDDEENGLPRRLRKKRVVPKPAMGIVKPGRSLRRAKSEDILSSAIPVGGRAVNSGAVNAQGAPSTAESLAEDDEVPLGHLNIGGGASLMRKYPSEPTIASTPSLSPSAPETPSASTPPAPEPLRNKKLAAASPLRQAASMDDLKKFYKDQPTPDQTILSIPNRTNASTKPTMTLIEKVELRQREARRSLDNPDEGNGPAFPARSSSLNNLASEEPAKLPASSSLPSLLKEQPIRQSLDTPPRDRDLPRISTDFIAPAMEKSKSFPQPSNSPQKLTIAPPRSATLPVSENTLLGKGQVKTGKKSGLMSLRSAFLRKKAEKGSVEPTSPVSASSAPVLGDQPAPLTFHPTSAPTSSPLLPPPSPPQKSPTSSARLRFLPILTTPKRSPPSPSSPAPPKSPQPPTPPSKSPLLDDIDFGSSPFGGGFSTASFEHEVFSGLAASKDIRRSFLLAMPAPSSVTRTSASSGSASSTEYRSSGSSGSLARRDSGASGGVDDVGTGDGGRMGYTLEGRFCELAFDLSWEVKL
ncbi:uncharacterized protein EV422DRAFT_117422 [Fimicolochytrium jonesii]|uniref:uncharacterized protein n=1 Tax=Fimicolochytrium jonesii TaxID=1396493 RepID=UPI0022FEC8B7|nr:uncharacterized protein EV422DRAFT_117422 [Fimicolochytrium jonesii]KAI8819107.1 hypothetical protein EV422DRAFT_117422 [Fimicolochytrium jonesii]